MNRGRRSLMQYVTVLLFAMTFTFMSVHAGRDYTPHEEEAQRVLSKNTALFELIPGRVNRAFKSIGTRLENFKSGRVRIMQGFVRQIDAKVKAIARLKSDLKMLLSNPSQLRRRTRRQINDLLTRIDAYEEAARAKANEVKKELRYIEKDLSVAPGSLTNPEKDEGVIRQREKERQDRKRASLENIMQKAEAFEGKSLEEVLESIAQEQKAIDAQITEDNERDFETLQEACAPLSDEDAVQAALENDDVDALVDALAVKARRPLVEEKDETVEVIEEFGKELKKDATNVARSALQGYRLLKGWAGRVLNNTKDAIIHNTNGLTAWMKALKRRTRRLRRERHAVQASPELRRYVNGKMRRAAEASLEGYRGLKRRVKKGSHRIVDGTLSGLSWAWNEFKNIPTRVREQFSARSYKAPAQESHATKLPRFVGEVSKDAKAAGEKVYEQASKVVKTAEKVTESGSRLASRVLDRARRRIAGLSKGTDARPTPELQKRVARTVDTALTSVYDTFKDTAYAIKRAVGSAASALSSTVRKTGVEVARGVRGAAAGLTNGIDATRRTVSRATRAVVGTLKDVTVGGTSRVVTESEEEKVIPRSSVVGWVRDMVSAFGDRCAYVYRLVKQKTGDWLLSVADTMSRIKERVQTDIMRVGQSVSHAYGRFRGDVKTVARAVSEKVKELPDKIAPNKKAHDELKFDEACARDARQASAQTPAPGCAATATCAAQAQGTHKKNVEKCRVVQVDASR